MRHPGILDNSQRPVSCAFCFNNFNMLRGLSHSYAGRVAWQDFLEASSVNAKVFTFDQQSGK